MSKKKTNLSYPENILIDELGIEKSVTSWDNEFLCCPYAPMYFNETIVPNFDKNLMLITNLTQREKTALFYHYRDGLTFKEIGNNFGVSQARTYQIVKKALAKLRNKRKLFITSYALNAKKFKKNEEDNFEISELPVEEQDISVLDISTRSYNALKRKGIHTIEQLTGVSLKELFRMRNLGMKSVKEILKAVKDKTGFVWDEQEIMDYFYK